MASNQTEHYGLNQWAAEDPFIRTEFNGDNVKIDSALAEKANQTEFLALSETVGLKCRIKAGTYIGDGADSRYISVGFPIQALLIEAEDGQRGGDGSPLCGGLALPGAPVGATNACTAEVQGTGFCVYKRSGYATLNGTQKLYRYLAFG